MKRTLTIVVVLAVAALALSPVAYMLFSTVYVETVVVRAGKDAPAPGYRAGCVVEIRELNPKELRLRIDEDHPLSVTLAPGAGVGFRPGDSITFSPPPGVLKHEPGSPVTLWAKEPEARNVLWSRGVLVRLEPGRAEINVEALNDLVVHKQALAGLDLGPESRVNFRPEKTLSLMNYHGLLGEVPEFFPAFFRWITFRKAGFPRRLGLLFNTLVVSLGTVALASILGVGYALLISKFETPGRNVFSWLYIAPLLIPPYISAIAWTIVLGEQGSVTRIIKSVFSLDKAPFTIYGIPGSILVLSLSFFPIMTLLAHAGLKTVHRELEEASLLHGGRFRTLWRVTLRLSAPYILSGAVFVFIFSLSASGAPALLRLQLYSSQVMMAFQTDLSGGEAMATGTPLVLLAVGAVIFQGVLHGKRGFSSGGGVPLRFPLGPAGKLLSAGACALILALAVGVPMAILLERAGSLQSFRTALVEMRADILHSILAAAAAATVAAVAGGFIGYLAARTPRGALLEIMSIIPYAAPASVVGAGLLSIWDRPGALGAVYVSGAVLALAGFTRFIPFAVKPASAAVRSFHPDLEEAARIHGVSWIRRILFVVLPLSARGMIAGWILVFILTLSELDAAILVAPAGVTTIPVRIFNAIHFGRVEVVSALCLILIFVAALPLMAYTLASSKKLRIL